MQKFRGGGGGGLKERERTHYLQYKSSKTPLDTVYSLSLICQPDIRGHEVPHHHHWIRWESDVRAGRIQFLFLPLNSIDFPSPNATHIPPRQSRCSQPQDNSRDGIGSERCLFFLFFSLSLFVPFSRRNNSSVDCWWAGHWQQNVGRWWRT